MLQSIKIEDKTFVCRFWRTFPPVLARATPMELALLRKDNDPLASPTEVQKLGVWERMCGILKMEESKCSVCPHRQEVIRKPHCVAMLRDPTGFESPAIDTPTIESHNRLATVGLRKRELPNE